MLTQLGCSSAGFKPRHYNLRSVYQVKQHPWNGNLSPLPVYIPALVGGGVGMEASQGRAIRAWRGREGTAGAGLFKTGSQGRSSM